MLLMKKIYSNLGSDIGPRGLKRRVEIIVTSWHIENIFVSALYKVYLKKLILQRTLAKK